MASHAHAAGRADTLARRKLRIARRRRRRTASRRRRATRARSPPRPGPVSTRTPTLSPAQRDRRPRAGDTSSPRPAIRQPRAPRREDHHHPAKGGSYGAGRSCSCDEPPKPEVARPRSARATRRCSRGLLHRLARAVQNGQGGLRGLEECIGAAAPVRLRRVSSGPGPRRRRGEGLRGRDRSRKARGAMIRGHVSPIARAAQHVDPSTVVVVRSPRDSAAEGRVQGVQLSASGVTWSS